ncbi:MAG: hypothetical protein RJA76_685 [Bacteroidota bacterium]|jgi:3-methyladenine DNA glycosylase AlkD
MSNWLESLKNELLMHANKENAFWMAKYMRNQFEFLGIKKPTQMEVFNKVFKSFDEPSTYLQIATQMRNLPMHEFHYLSMVLVIKMKKHWDEQIPVWVEEMTLQYPWWDVTDVLAPKILGPYFLQFPQEREKYINRWMQSNHIWLQRLCILYALDYKQKLNVDDLKSIIMPLASSKEFFIQKAIGWMLRQYARTNPSWVRAFVSNHTLSNLTRREALKHLT